MRVPDLQRAPPKRTRCALVFDVVPRVLRMAEKHARAMLAGRPLKPGPRRERSQILPTAVADVDHANRRMPPRDGPRQAPKRSTHRQTGRTREHGRCWNSSFVTRKEQAHFLGT